MKGIYYWILHEHCNYLQITQIKDYLQKLLNVQIKMHNNIHHNDILHNNK